MNKIVEAWGESDFDEREEFLKELHKRYGIERICKSLIVEKRNRNICAGGSEVVELLKKDVSLAMLKIDLLEVIR